METPGWKLSRAGKPSIENNTATARTQKAAISTATVGSTAASEATVTSRTS
jgi:hypothetical protein